MTHEIIMPKLGETMEEGYLVGWRKAVGDRVEKGEVLFEVMSDKTNFEVEATHSGYLRRILYQPGEQPIPVTSVIGYLTDTPDEALVEKQGPEKKEEQRISPQPSETQITAKVTSSAAQERIPVSPLARKLALEKGVDIRLVRGSGPGGRITEKDVTDYLKEKETSAYQVVSWTPMRKIIADRMTQSKSIIPHYYVQISVLMDQIVRMKELLKKEGKHYSYTDFLVFYCSRAIKEFPLLDAALMNDEIRIYPQINIGLAVAVENGLVVPVIRNCAQKSLQEISTDIDSLTKLARNNQLKKEHTEGCRFVVSNLGMYQIENFYPIINPPGVAIMGVGAINRQILPTEHGTTVAFLMKINLSLDHRVIDGAYAGRFLSRLKNLLEQPGLLAL